MNNKEETEVNNEFLDIEGKKNNNYIIVVIILYIVVIILTVILILSIKGQKDTIKNNNKLENNINITLDKN